MIIIKANLRQRKRILDLEQEVQQLRIQNGKLMEEKQEMEMKNEKLVRENKDLKLRAMDVGQYENWTWKEILQWILMIENSRFVKYKSDISKALSEEEPIGQDLEKVNEGDIKRWGIKKFGDIKVLYEHIQRLVHRHNDGNVALVDHEGAVSGEYYK